MDENQRIFIRLSVGVHAFNTILTSDTNLFQPANGSIENKMEDPHTLKIMTSACVNEYLFKLKS